MQLRNEHEILPGMYLFSDADVQLFLNIQNCDASSVKGNPVQMLPPQ